MRKYCIISFLMLLFPMLVLALTPAELAGTWTSEEPVELMSSENGSLTVIPNYEFTRDGKIKETSTLFLKQTVMDIVIISKIRTRIEGTYKIKGNYITISNDFPNATISCVREDVEVKGNLTPEQKSKVIDSSLEMINSYLIPDVKADVIQNPKETWGNVSVTANTLSYTSAGQDMILKKK